MLVNSGCVTQKNYKILSFFFDGVPDPVQQKTVSEDTLRQENGTVAMQVTSTRNNVQYYYHEGIRDKSCDNCHDPDAGNRLSEPQPVVCYNCHDDFSEQYETVHGPVAGGYCTACHNIHRSQNEHLLKYTSPELCLYCHDSQDVFANEVHEDMEDADCRECHNPHGADGEFLLE